MRANKLFVVIVGWALMVAVPAHAQLSSPLKKSFAQPSGATAGLSNRVFHQKRSTARQASSGTRLLQPAVRAMEEKGIRLDKQVVQRYQFGMIVHANNCVCRGVFGTVPFPAEWPEQEIRIVDEEFTPEVRRVEYRTLPGGAKQMLIYMPTIAYGETAKALITVEVRRSSILGPRDPTIFKIPKKLKPADRRYLMASPLIESRNTKIRSLAKKIVKDKESAWEKVEAIYDWVRDHVEYKDSKIKGALAALRDGDGDCEELTSLFIALCRASKIPARTVWVPGHCYPEFMLADEEKKNHWIPCQAAGTRSFGDMPELRPILQKGDNFKVPEKKKPQRYIAEFLRVKSVAGGGKPRVTFVRELLPAK